MLAARVFHMRACAYRPACLSVLSTRYLAFVQRLGIATCSTLFGPSELFASLTPGLHVLRHSLDLADDRCWMRLPPRAPACYTERHGGGGGGSAQLASPAAAPSSAAPSSAAAAAAAAACMARLPRVNASFALAAPPFAGGSEAAHALEESLEAQLRQLIEQHRAEGCPGDGGGAGACEFKLKCSVTISFYTHKNT